MPTKRHYSARKISAALIKVVAAWSPPDKPHEILDSDQGLVLRHQPSGYLSLYAQLGRGKRERVCNARDILDTNKPITFRQAVSRAKVLQGKSEEGEDFKAYRQAARAVPTFARFLEETYKPWIMENRRTGAATADRIEKLFLDRFKHFKLDEITPDKLEAWKTRRRRDDVKPETINRDITALKAMLGHAVRPLGKIKENPLNGYQLEKVDRNRKVVRAFTEAEEKALREALAARDEKMRAERQSANDHRRNRGYELLPSLHGYADYLTPAVLVAIGTGLRRGEQFALTWEKSIDFDRKLIIVAGESSKTYETREIPMSAEVRKVLRAWQMKQGRPVRGYVFLGAGGARLQNLKRSFYAVIENAEIERGSAKGRLSWHSLRHTFATRLVTLGIDVETVRALLGHAQVSTVINRYLHTSENRLRDAVQRLTTIGGE